MIRAMEGRAARHAAQRKHLQLDRLAGQLGPRLVPIDLASLPRRIALRHTGGARRPAQLPFAFAHVLPHRHLRHLVLRQLAPDPLEDPVRGVTLLARRIAIGLQDSVDERLQRSNYRPFSLALLALRRLSIRQRLTHHPPMHPELGGNSLNRPNPELVFPPDLLEQLHLRSPLHPEPPTSSAGCSAMRGWANSENRSGPNQTIEIRCVQRRLARSVEDRPCPWSKLRQPRKGWRVAVGPRTVARMLSAVRAIVILVSFRFRSRASLELEVLALRHQLAVLRRQRPGRPRLLRIDRLFWVCLTGCGRAA